MAALRQATATPDGLPDALIFPAPPGNFSSRHNTPVDLVVIHCTEGPFHSALLWFANPKSGASAHYVVSRTGTVAACVPEGDEAWHAGNAAVNRRSIGIELEGYVADAGSFPADSVLVHTAAHLVANVCARHRIPVDREHIVGHSEIADPKHPSEEWIGGGAHHHGDPGPFFPWPAFLRLVSGLEVSP